MKSSCSHLFWGRGLLAGLWASKTVSSPHVSLLIWKYQSLQVSSLLEISFFFCLVTKIKCKMILMLAEPYKPGYCSFSGKRVKFLFIQNILSILASID